MRAFVQANCLRRFEVYMQHGTVQTREEIHLVL